MKPQRPYTSLQDYMERTSTNGLKLLALVKDQTGHTISPSLLSMILRGSRRCSRFNAFAIHIATGIPMDALVSDEFTRSETAKALAQTDARNCSE